ncbi:hypothetical protein ACS0Y3_19040 [Burkholderia gladioli]|uniref:hypothetical protein n=1 Tax=Burkholderia gladioli TaxID=28095 RepID=UPI003F7AA46B
MDAFGAFMGDWPARRISNLAWKAARCHGFRVRRRHYFLEFGDLLFETVNTCPILFVIEIAMLEIRMISSFDSPARSCEFVLAKNGRRFSGGYPGWRGDAEMI